MASSHHVPDVAPGLTVSGPEAISSSGNVVETPADDVTVITNRPAGGDPPKALPPREPLELGRLLAGERLDHFELHSFVGGGGMGAVFRARDTLLNREVALKVLPRDQGNEEENRRRFRNEAQSAARLDHENIARVYYVGEDKGLNYIVFEFIEGLNLRQLVEQRGGPLPIADALSYTWQVAKALEHAHSRDVVHRDIKPSNVLVTAEGKAKLVDMGLARLHDVENTNDLTASGVTLGTFDYISPEQARDPRNADVRSDLYSLGCTLYYVLTGRPPFPEGTVLQKLLQHNSDAPPDPREFNDQVPEELAAIVARLLVKNPQKRYQTPGELIGDLHRLSEHLGLTLAELGVPAPQAPPVALGTAWERHLPWAAPVAALLLLVIAIEWASRWSPSSSLDSRFAAFSAGLPKETETIPATSNPASNGKSPTSDVPAIVGPDGMPKLDGGVKSPASEAANHTIPAASTPSTPVTVTAPNPAETTPLGVLVVTPTPSGPQQFATLRAACAAAKNGDVIELRYSGEREERPLELKNRRLTIRAGESFQPTVAYRPSEVDPLRYPRSMFSVLGGRLTLVGVELQLDVPSPRDIAADEWSLLATQRADLVELKSCTLTVRNHLRGGQSQHPDVSMIHVRAAAGFDAMMADDATDDTPPEIQLENCIARGEAVFLKVSDLQAARVTWNNGLLTTSENLVTVLGGQVMPRQDSKLELALRHLTASLGQGFCKFDHTIQTPYVLETSIECKDSILRAVEAAPLVEQQRVDPADVFHKQFSWSGDRNTYLGFDRSAFWRVTEVTSPGQVRQFNFDQWCEHWGAQAEILPRGDQVLWRKLPDRDAPPHSQVPADFALAEGVSQPARGSASDGADVGMIAPLLSDVPPPDG